MRIVGRDERLPSGGRATDAWVGEPRENPAGMTTAARHVSSGLEGHTVVSVQEDILPMFGKCYFCLYVCLLNAIINMVKRICALQA